MKKLALLLVALVAIGAVFGRDQLGVLADSLTGTPPTATASAATVSVELPPAPPVRTRLVLLDPTTSTDTSFREAMKAQLVADVRSYIPAKPTVTKEGTAALPGVHLVVRLVGTSPLQYGAPIYTEDIPSVAALPVRPDMTADGALDPGGPYDLWKAAEAAWSAQYDAALAAAQQATTDLQGMNLALDERSGVTAGLASLSLLRPQGDVAYALLSDLDENSPQAAAAFNGAPLLVVQPDPVGDQARWNALYQGFSSWATANGAGAVERVRPEASAAALTAFIQGVRS